MNASILSLWQRLPVIARAVIAGLAVLLAGELPWGGLAGHAALAGWNGRALVAVPWAIAPMTLYLWLYWRYLGGAGWPQLTAQLRRTNLRANRLSSDVWGMSLLAGLIGLATLLPLTRILGRLVTLPADAEPITTPAHMPFVTMFLLVAMASIVAGVVEEAVFRGYMQGPIERRHGPIAAILVTGVMFGLLHYNHHPASVLVMLPFYIAVAAVYGGVTYLTNSILPAVVLHAGGDLFSLTRLWATGQPDWQLSASPATPGLIWRTGIDFSFARSVVVFTVLGAAAIWAYATLARTARSA
jgi:membrane protease YdiL (CAAX protease family)